MQVSSAKRLNEHLAKTRTVQVEDQDGSKWHFKIRPVPMLLWDPGSEWYAKLLAKDEKAFGERLEAAIVAPSVDIIREVLISGVAEPKITRDAKGDSEGSVVVEDLLRKDLLARRLYAEIAALAFEGIKQVEIPDAKSRSIN